MKRSGVALACVWLSAVVLGVWASGQTASPATQAATAPACPEVTLKGVLMTEASCLPSPPKDADKTIVLFAVEGTPEVAATVDAIMKECYPGESLSPDQARKMNEAFEQRLKFYVTPTELTSTKDSIPRYRNPAKAVTGVVSEHDGKKWITPSKIAPATLKYPDKLLAPDKPAAPAGKALVLKVSDTLSLKCILLPPGRFLERVPFYWIYSYDGSQMRYDDDYPRMVTLTKPFFLAEIPVTQEMYEAVMGDNPSPQKGPQLPVTSAPAADIKKFCQALSEKNGRKVRLPTAAEREYAARVGTSTPPCNEKYQDQDSAGPKGTLLPVKSKQPSAWGLYDMFGPSWEMTGSKLTFVRKDETDPHVPGLDVKGWGSHAGMGRDAFSWLTSREGISDGTGGGYGLTRFRVAVDATDEEAAELARTTSAPAATAPARP